jgi:hypothetical protein
MKNLEFLTHVEKFCTRSFTTYFLLNHSPMKRVLLFGIVASTVFLSCKKDQQADKAENLSASIIDPANRTELSQSLKVAYGTAVQGNIPASGAGNGSPVLYNGSLTINAFKGRYLVIHPILGEGTAEGYYLKVNGADEYYKIDYTKARNLRKKAPKERPFLRSVDASDSVIVFKLPANVQSDTFSITFAAYDSLHQVSNYINHVISMHDLSDNTTNQPLLGTWKLSRTFADYSGWNDIHYGKDSFYIPFKCENGTLISCEDGEGGCVDRIITYVDSLVNDYKFEASNIFNAPYYYASRNMDFQRSICDSLFYEPSVDQYNGGGEYSYDPVSNTLAIVYDEYEEGGYGSIRTEFFNVEELTANKVVLSYTYFNTLYKYEYTRK